MGDVGVWSYSFAGSNFIGIKNLKTQTDGDGHFRLTGLPKGPGNKLLIVPNDDQPYFMQEFDVPDPPGIGAVAVEIGAAQGDLYRGQGHGIRQTGNRWPGAGCITSRSWTTSLPRRPPNSTPGGYTPRGRPPAAIPDQGGRRLSPGRPAGSGPRRGGRLYRQALPPGRRVRVDQGDERARALPHLEQPRPAGSISSPPR